MSQPLAPSSPAPTALVTGASSGIGAALAREYAAHGHALVLVARSADRLEALAAELRTAYRVRVDVVPLDLARPDAADVLVARLGELGVTVDVLVNNAGFAAFGAFTDIDWTKEAEMIQVNVVTLTALTKKLVPGMVARRRGKILNVASTAAFFPGPLMAVYYATKAFVLSLSEALTEELRGTGVTVTALCPGPVETGFQARAALEESRLVAGKRLPGAAEIARVGFTATERGAAVVIPGAQNRIQTFLPRLFPRSLIRRVVRQAQERVTA